PVRLNFLLVGGPARKPRDSGNDLLAGRAGRHTHEIPHSNPIPARPLSFLVLALCRRGLGGCLYGCVHHRQVNRIAPCHTNCITEKPGNGRSSRTSNCLIPPSGLWCLPLASPCFAPG